MAFETLNTGRAPAWTRRYTVRMAVCSSCSHEGEVRHQHGSGEDGGDHADSRIPQNEKPSTGHFLGFS
jgi:hypothetical protein